MSDPTELTRRCRICGEVKPIVGGFYTATKKRSQCRECSRKYFAEYARERTEYVRDLKLSSGCIDCGYKEHPAALEFDHRPDEIKVADVGQLRYRGTWQQFLDEIDKCDIVCANCHRIRTHSRPPAMALHDLRDKSTEDAIGGYRPAPDPDQLGLFDESA